MNRKNEFRAALLSFGFAVSAGTAICSTNALLDNFNDGNFAGWTVNAGTWTINNGALQGVGAGGLIDGWIYTGDTNWSDIVYEADVNFVSGNSEFVFRSTGHWSNEYRLTIWAQNSPANPNMYSLARFRDGVSTSFTVSNVASAVPITPNSHVRVEAIGSLLSFYVNDALVYQVDDLAPLLNGQVGLGVIWDMTARFDNVSVELVPEANALGYASVALALIVCARARRKSLVARAAQSNRSN